MIYKAFVFTLLDQKTNLPSFFSSDGLLERQQLISANHILAIIVLLLVLIFVLLMSACLLKYSEWICNKQRYIKEIELNNISSRIYYTESVLQKPQTKRPNTITAISFKPTRISEPPPCC